MGVCNGESSGHFEAFVTQLLEQFVSDGSKEGTAPWDALRQKFGKSQPEIAQCLVSMKATVPFAQGTGVCYIPFQKVPVTAKTGTLHVGFLNAFQKESFPLGLYYEDIGLGVQEVLHKGFDKAIAVASLQQPITVSTEEFGNGALRFGADGAYSNGVHVFVCSFVALASTLPGCPVMPELLQHNLAALRGSHTRHVSSDARCVHILRETAVEAALARPLDPFMVCTAFATMGADAPDKIRQIIAKHNQTFFARPQLQLKG